MDRAPPICILSVFGLHFSSTSLAVTLCVEHDSSSFCIRCETIEVILSVRGIEKVEEVDEEESKKGTFRKSSHFF